MIYCRSSEHMDPKSSKQPDRGSILIDYSYECILCETPCSKRHLSMTLTPVKQGKKQKYPSKEEIAQLLIEVLAAHLIGTSTDVMEALQLAARAGAATADMVGEIYERRNLKKDGTLH